MSNSEKQDTPVETRNLEINNKFKNDSINCDGINYEQKYRTKMNQSFDSKLELYIFSLIIKKIDLPEFIDTNGFREFKIDDNICNNYAKAWQLKKDEEFCGIKANMIDNLMTDWYNKYEEKNKTILRVEYENIFIKIFPKDEFISLLKNGQCYYCGIDFNRLTVLIEQGNLFKKHFTRGKTIELDRYYPYEEYSFENTVPCCYWCNNAKTDEFFGEEFEEIAVNITKIWNKRLEKVEGNIITADEVNNYRIKINKFRDFKS